MMRSKAISLSISAALLVSVAGMAGCTTKQPANTNVRTKNVHDARGLNGMNGRLNVNSLRDGGRLSTYGTDGTSTDGTRHNVNNLTSSQALADKVAALKEVRTANVLRSGNSAYVAVSLENAATKGHMGAKSITGNYGMKSTNSSFRSSSFGTMNNSSFNNTGMGTTSTGTTGTGTTGTGNPGMYGGTLGTGSYGIMRGVTGTGTGAGTGIGTTGTGTGTGMHGYSTSSGVPITKSNGFNATTPGTSGTNETLTQHNAAQNDINVHIKNKVSDVIKKADPSITNVYVSANPDFVQRVSNYATEVKNGRPIGGMVSELSTMFERIFPMHSGTGTYNYNNTNNRVTPMGNTPTAPLGKTPAGRHMMQ